MRNEKGYACGGLIKNEDIKACVTDNARYTPHSVYAAMVKEVSKFGPGIRETNGSAIKENK